MREKFFGNEYDFIIELEKYDNVWFFQILSLYKKEGLKSIITNLNFLISELIFPVLHTTDLETEIKVKEKQGKRLFKQCYSVFKDESWIKSLEKSLDEDRLIGGWNANFIF